MFRKQEALKLDEKKYEIQWNCKVGDILEFINDVTTHSWDKDHEEVAKKGDRYKVQGQVENGFDLVKISGEGPEEIRILNSLIPTYLKVV